MDLKILQELLVWGFTIRSVNRIEICTAVISGGWGTNICANKRSKNRPQSKNHQWGFQRIINLNIYQQFLEDAPMDCKKWL